MADELTAVFGAMLAYVAVLAVLGVGIIHLLGLDDLSPPSGPGPRAAAIVLEQADVPDRPALRQGTAR